MTVLYYIYLYCNIHYFTVHLCGFKPLTPTHNVLAARHPTDAQ